MKSNKDFDRAFWSVVLKLSSNIYDIYSFMSDALPNHSPVLSKEEFNSIKRVNECAHDLSKVATSMINKLNKDEI